jgi:sugar fermentation stimulation protein A
MRLPASLIAGRFISRPNRFAAWIEVEGTAVYCHMPNPGRMVELLHEGVAMWVEPRPGTERRTTHQVVLARHGETMVSLVSGLPPELFLEAWHAGLVPELGHCPQVKREVSYGKSRLDLELTCEHATWLIETKSCTLVDEGVARFPDAPTVRGRKHVLELSTAAELGFTPAVAFVIQRDDAHEFRPNDGTDPDFGSALRAAAERDVQMLAIVCSVSTTEIVPLRRIPVVL